MPSGVDLIPVVLLGMFGAALTVVAIYLIAARWKRRSGIAYGISAFVFYVCFYIATFEYGILDAIRSGKSVPGNMLDILVLGHGVVTAIGVTIFTLLVLGLFVGLRPTPDKLVDPAQVYSGCAAFCLTMAVFLNPIGAAERIRGGSFSVIDAAGLSFASVAGGSTARAAKQQVQRPPAVFPEPGFVRRVEIKGGRITHFVSDDVGRRAGARLEAYARKALAHRLYFDNGKPGLVVIRGAKSGRHLATRYPDGRFRQQIASRKSGK